MPKTSALARKGLSSIRTHNKQHSNDIDLKSYKTDTATESTASMALNIGNKVTTVRNKRKADPSPVKNERAKRSALGNLTNAVVAVSTDSDVSITKKDGGTKVTQTAAATKNVFAQARNAVGTFTKPAITRTTKILTRAASRGTSGAKKQTTMTEANALMASTKATATNLPTGQNVLKKEPADLKLPQKKRRITNEFDKTEDNNTLYMSALEDVTISEAATSAHDTKATALVKTNSTESTASYASASSGPTTNTDGRLSSLINASIYSTPVLGPGPPDGVDDFDKENLNDPFQVAEYSEYIFEYLKRREPFYVIDDYMERQPHLSKWMRSLLIDWMVEVQESFELNHETLYLAVKMVDLYLCRERVTKETIQLLGAAALFIACKYDERTPPLIDDFRYICDGAYTKKELIAMEIKLFKTIDYELGMPLSYRFLRRYARCAKVTMSILTLARFILEYSLMDYDIIRLSDSKVASAALFMALRMNHLDGWNPTLEYYTGYKLSDFAHIILLLNVGLHRKPKETINTVRTKYSHKIFHEVATIPLLTHIEMLQGMSHTAWTPALDKATLASSQPFNYTANLGPKVESSPAIVKTRAASRSSDRSKP